MCKAMGDPQCRFLVADLSKIYFLLKDLKFSKPRKEYKVMYIS